MTFLFAFLWFGVENREEYDTQANLPFRRRVFLSHLDGQLITGIDIENAILGPTFAELYNEDAVGICCLGILQLVLLGAENRRNVPEWLLRIANDRVAWNKYPWGSYVWPTLYRQFVEQKIELERNKKDVHDIKEEMQKFRQEMNARSVRQENTVPIIVGQHYGLSDFSEFRSMQGGPSSFMNMGTPPKFQTPMRSQPGSSDWQRQMPEQSASYYWQPSPHPGSYYLFGQVPSHMGRPNLQTTIDTQHDVDGIVDQYLVTPFTVQAPTTMVPNSVESVNACSVIYRKEPVLKLAETYRAMVQECKYDVRNNRLGSKQSGKKKMKSATWVVKGVNAYQYEVSDGQYIREVNLQTGICGCRKWQLSGLSCGHVKAITRFLGLTDERVGLLINSLGGSSTTTFSQATSSSPSLSPTPSTTPIYYGGSSTNTECSNCKHLLGRIKVLQATLEMYRHPEQHTLNSAALLHDLNNDMEKLGLE
ncbi:phospholipase-like protein [Tanacetum coccineum]